MDKLYLTHNNDGKEKFQSHTVSFGEFQDWNNRISSPELYCDGYGSTYEEVFEEFKEKLYKLNDQFQSFVEQVKSGNIKPVKVDCLNKVIGKIEEEE